MSEEEYRKYIKEMVERITDVKHLKRIYLIVHSLFIRSAE